MAAEPRSHSAWVASHRATRWRPELSPRRDWRRTLGRASHRADSVATHIGSSSHRVVTVGTDVGSSSLRRRERSGVEGSVGIALHAALTMRGMGAVAAWRQNRDRTLLGSHLTARLGGDPHWVELSPRRDWRRTLGRALTARRACRPSVGRALHRVVTGDVRWSSSHRAVTGDGRWVELRIAPTRWRPTLGRALTVS
jgi:hypothetical protein